MGEPFLWVHANPRQECPGRFTQLFDTGWCVGGGWPISDFPAPQQLGLVADATRCSLCGYFGFRRDHSNPLKPTPGLNGPSGLRGRYSIPESSRTNADDRLSLDPLGPPEGGNRIVEGSHIAYVCPQPANPDPLHELTQLGAIRYDDEV